MLYNQNWYFYLDLVPNEFQRLNSFGIMPKVFSDWRRLDRFGPNKITRAYS